MLTATLLLFLKAKITDFCKRLEETEAVEKNTGYMERKGVLFFKIPKITNIKRSLEGKSPQGFLRAQNP